MTYAQHTSGSPPGPVAGYPWMKACLDYLLSLGVRPVWDSAQKTPSATWEVNGVFRHAWVEDSRAFMAKLELVTSNRLRGYSV